MTSQRPITQWFSNDTTNIITNQSFIAPITDEGNNNSNSVPVEDDDKLICFTDGSSLSNGKSNSKSGYSCVFPYRNVKISETIYRDNPTNNRAELKGILRSYKEADIIDSTKKKTLIIYTDSKLCINSLDIWISGWKRNNWIKPDKQHVKNVDLLKLIDQEQSQRPHEYRHVKAHTGKKDWISIQNDIADKLAQDAARRI